MRPRLAALLTVTLAAVVAAAEPHAESSGLSAPPSGEASVVEGPRAPDALFGALALDWSGRIQSELHYRVAEKAAGAFYDRRVLPEGFVRNENTVGLRLAAAAGRMRGVADVELDWFGFARATELAQLTTVEAVSPLRVQANAVYLEADDLFVEGLDLRLGQQVVAWGVGDQFNPTNTLNAEDLENVLFFGRQQANLMARADYALASFGSVTAVLVPIFKPALLPASAPFGLTAVDRLPFIDPALRWRLHSGRGTAQDFGYPTVVRTVRIVTPEPALDNMQAAVRVAGSIVEQDVALSYYYGRNDFPIPVRNHVSQTVGAVCDPADPRQCIQGLLQTDVEARFPRMHVVGLNLAGELDALGWLRGTQPLGYRLELGAFFPRAQRFRITQDELNIGIIQPAGELDYRQADGKAPLVLPSTPFLKWVLGVDYSFGRYVYVNGMWVHGLVDELGAGDFMHEGWSVRAARIPPTASALVCSASDALRATPGAEACPEEILRPRLGDYLVFGLDLKFAQQQGLVRLFAIVDLSGVVIEKWDDAVERRVRQALAFWAPQAFSAVLYPELAYNFGNGLELSLGALLQLGRPHTKFGDPAAGGSLVWARGKLAF